MSCSTVTDAWSLLEDIVMPNTPTQRRALGIGFAAVAYPADGTPSSCFTMFDRLLNQLRAVGMTNSEDEVVQNTIHCLPE